MILTAGCLFPTMRTTHITSLQYFPTSPTWIGQDRTKILA
jgi:hypothetical protein